MPSRHPVIPYGRAIPLLGIDLREMVTYDHAKTHTPMFLAAFFIIAPKWKQLECLERDK